MRIAFVTQWFPPEPAGVPAAIATGLASRGHQVDVLTGFPNYPSGHLADGYRVRAYQRERYSAQVTVHRAPLYPSHDTSAARRMVNYTSFALGAATVAATRMPNPDVWLTYSSPATAAIPALTTGRLRALTRRDPHQPVRHYQIIQDLWPDSVTASGFVAGSRAGGAIESVLDRYCRWGYRHSAGIGVISPGMRHLLTERGVSPERIHDTPNWVDSPAALPVATPEQRAELGLPGGRLFMYAGNLGELQALDPLIDAFAAQPGSDDQDQGSDASAERPLAQLVLIGDGVVRDRLARRAATIANVHVLPSQPPERIEAYLAAADVLVVSLADTPLLRVTMPSKVQSYLAAGRPILAHAAGDAADVVSGSGAGLGASPADPAAVRAAIDTLTTCPDAHLAQFARAARARYEAHYTPTVGLDCLEAMLTDRRPTQELLAHD